MTHVSVCPIKLGTILKIRGISQACGRVQVSPLIRGYACLLVHEIRIDELLLYEPDPYPRTMWVVHTLGFLQLRCWNSCTYIPEGEPEGPRVVRTLLAMTAQYKRWVRLPLLLGQARHTTRYMPSHSRARRPTVLVVLTSLGHRAI